MVPGEVSVCLLGVCANGACVRSHLGGVDHVQELALLVEREGICGKDGMRANERTDGRRNAMKVTQSATRRGLTYTSRM